MPLGALIPALALAALTGASAVSAPSPPSTVSCDTVILRAGSGRAGSYRVVLGVISVPPSYSVQAAVPTGSRPWAYFRKAGLVIRGGAPPVDVSVPKAWRSRVRIGWGNAGGSAVRFASCPASGPKRWNVWSGGFHLRSPTACVPLVFRVGNRSATVRFGIGRTCS